MFTSNCCIVEEGAIINQHPWPSVVEVGGAIIPNRNTTSIAGEASVTKSYTSVIRKE